MSQATITRTVTYSIEELETVFPDGYAGAYDAYETSVYTDPDDYTLSELIDSWQAISRVAGVSLGRWEIGGYHTYCEPSFPTTYGYDGAGDLTGARAYAWIEHNILAPVRLPWAPIAANEQRQRYARYGYDYAPGHVPPCPFTSVGYDEDLLAALLDTVRQGGSLSDGWQAMARACAAIAESEREHRATEEYWRDYVADEWRYLADGTRV